jgi:hypothetical protein
MVCQEIPGNVMKYMFMFCFGDVSEKGLGGGGRPECWFSGRGSPPSNSGPSPAKAGEYHQFEKKKPPASKTQGINPFAISFFENFAKARPAKIEPIALENRFRGNWAFRCRLFRYSPGQLPPQGMGNEINDFPHWEFNS